MVTVKADNKIQLLSLGVDWLTVTQKHGDEADRLRAIAFGITDAELQNGMFGRHWGANGYEGFSVGHLEYGERSMDVITRVHGAVAHAHWRRLYENCRNVSRIDLEVTVRTNEDPRKIVRRHLRQLQRYKRSLKRGPQVEYRVDDNGGMTVYSGSVQSSRRLRIYDKERESGEKQWRGGVRYEVQFNGKQGLWAASAISQENRLVTRVAHLVLGFVLKRGGRVRHLYEALCSGSDVSTPPPFPVSATDADSRLRWIEKSVAPSVQRLVELKGQVAVLKALGFA